MACRSVLIAPTGGAWEIYYMGSRNLLMNFLPPPYCQIPSFLEWSLASRYSMDGFEPVLCNTKLLA
jgi:hypothetical protein